MKLDFWRIAIVKNLDGLVVDWMEKVSHQQYCR